MKETIVVCDKKKIYSFSIQSILRLEAQGVYTIIHFKNKEQFVCTRHLKLMLAELDPKLFFRIHKSHVINLREIKTYEKGRGGYVVLSDGTSLAVSQRKKGAFLKRFRKL